MDDSTRASLRQISAEYAEQQEYINSVVEEIESGNARLSGPPMTAGRPQRCRREADEN